MVELKLFGAEIFNNFSNRAYV